MRRDGGFGIWTLTFLVVASMVGAGVFTTSGYTLGSLRDPSLVLWAWLVGGVIALAGAYSYGRLVRLIPESGGEYAFLSRAAHPFLGFTAGWVSLLAGFSGAIAFAATTLESYLPFGGGLPEGTVAVIAVLLGAGLHGFYRSTGVATQNLSVAIKLGLIVVFIVIAGVDWGGGDWKGTALPVEPESGPWWLAFAQALVWISLSYSGFNAAVYVAGEAKSPRAVAKALLAGTAVVVVMYLLLNGAFVLAPAPEAIAGQEDVAALAAEAIGGGRLEAAVRAVIGLAMFTSVLSMMMAGPRVYAKMADDGFLPKQLQLRPDRHWPPVILQAAIAIAMILVTTLKDLFDYLGLTLSLSAAASVACLFMPKIRKELKSMELILPAFFVVATLVLAGLFVARDPWQALGTVLTVVVAAVMYFLTKIGMRRGEKRGEPGA
jgi:APA family basic amino acid/polyamine antiporter